MRRPGKMRWTRCLDYPTSTLLDILVNHNLFNAKSPNLFARCGLELYYYHNTRLEYRYVYSLFLQ